ncbi:signal peptidase II [Limosilactobacillus viscerum]|uniref:signal peptidase II n=1 Tax=Limosilactobacillus viscerum TaxID=2993450 RepID=UPI0024BAEB83|nr:signal peptidase II [Limosilactobacillus viscerum]
MIGYLIFTAALVVGDQLVKHWVSATIALNSSQPVVPNLLAITNLRNDGAAWSILEGQQWFFTVVTLIALAVLAYLFYRWRRQPRLLWPLTLILAGAIGNFIDRLQNGYVVDMFELLFINFPVFNVADLCLTVGVLWLVVIFIREEE